MHVITREHDTVDALCWRHLGSTAQLVEQTYLLNPGLAALGAILPAGLAVQLPDAVPAPVQPAPVTLWS